MGFYTVKLYVLKYKLKTVQMKMKMLKLKNKQERKSMLQDPATCLVHNFEFPTALLLRFLIKETSKITM